MDAWSYNPNMKGLFVLALTLLTPFAAAAQERKTPVSVQRTGNEQVGTLFVEALNRELSRSSRFEPMSENERGFRFFVELATVDVADAAPEKGKRSVVSVVVEEMGRPDSFPVMNLWYHKVIVVNRRLVDSTAKELLEDMDARWCSYIRNAVVGCPKEKFEPRIAPN
jgi:hypothetical protein